MGGIVRAFATESSEGRPAALDSDRRIEAGVRASRGAIFWWIFEDADRRAASGVVRGRKCG